MNKSVLVYRLFSRTCVCYRCSQDSICLLSIVMVMYRPASQVFNALLFPRVSLFVLTSLSIRFFDVTYFYETIVGKGLINVSKDTTRQLTVCLYSGSNLGLSTPYPNRGYYSPIFRRKYSDSALKQATTLCSQIHTYINSKTVYKARFLQKLNKLQVRTSYYEGRRNNKIYIFILKLINFSSCLYISLVTICN